MRGILVCIAGAVATMAVWMSMGGASVTAQQTCLHASDDQAQAARRQQAVAVSRQINTQQAKAFGTSKAYLPLSQLSVTPPEGFAVQLSADAAGYSFSVVDRTDPCRFGLFSSQEGLIYRGQVIQ